MLVFSVSSANRLAPRSECKRVWFWQFCGRYWQRECRGGQERRDRHDLRSQLSRRDRIRDPFWRVRALLIGPLGLRIPDVMRLVVSPTDSYRNFG